MFDINRHNFVATSCTMVRAFERQEDGYVPCSSSSTLHDVLQSLTLYNKMMASL